MNNSIEISKFLTLSTLHITHKDSIKMQEESLPQDDWSYWFYVPELDSEDIILNGYSSALIKAVRLARKHDCKYIKFDCDGLVNDTLPKFDW